LLQKTVLFGEMMYPKKRYEVVKEEGTASEKKNRGASKGALKRKGESPTSKKK